MLQPIEKLYAFPCEFSCAPLQPIWYEIARQTDLDMAWNLQNACPHYDIHLYILYVLFKSIGLAKTVLIWPKVGSDAYETIVTITFPGHNFWPPKHEVFCKIG